MLLAVVNGNVELGVKVFVLAEQFNFFFQYECELAARCSVSKVLVSNVLRILFAAKDGGSRLRG